MTPTFCCGFECQQPTFTSGTSSHWDSRTGTAAQCGFNTSTKRTGSASLGIDTTGGGATAFLQRPSFAAGVKRLVGRFYVRIDTNVGARNGIVVAIGNNGMRIGLHTTGAIYAQAALGATQDSAATYADGAWHRVDFDFDRTGGTATVRWRVDGTVQTDATSVVAAADMTGFRVGLDGVTTGKFQIEDLVLSVTGADYPIGAGYVLGHVPIATGAHSFTAGDFQDDASSNLAISPQETTSWNRIEEVPPTTTEHVKQVVIRTTGYLEYQVDACKGNSPRGVEVIATVHNVGTQADTQKAVLWDGTTAADVYALATAGGTAGVMRSLSKCFALTPTSGAWSKSAFDACRVRWGFSGDVTHVPALSALMVEVEFAPDPVTSTPGVLALTTASFAPRAQLGFRPTPPTKALTTATFAPAVTATAHQRVTAGVLALTTTRFAPQLRLAVIPPTKSLATSSFAPVVSAPRLVTPGKLSLALSTFAPTAAAPRLVTPGKLALTTATFAPRLALAVIPGVKALATATFAPAVAATAHQRATPGVASLTTATFAPQLRLAVVPPTRALTLTPFAPTARAPRTATPGPASLSTTGYAPTVTSPRLVVPGSLSATLTPFAPTARAPRLVTPAVNALSLSTFEPDVTATDGSDVTATPGKAALVTARFAPTVSTPRTVTPGAVSLILTRFAPAFVSPRTATPGPAAVTLQGFAPTITAPANVRSTPGRLALALTAFAPALVLPQRAVPGPLGLALTPFAPAALTPAAVAPPASALLLTAFAPAIGLDATATPGPLGLTLHAFAPAAIGSLPPVYGGSIDGSSRGGTLEGAGARRGTLEDGARRGTLTSDSGGREGTLE